MYWLIALMSLSVVSIVILGIYYEIHPNLSQSTASSKLKKIIGFNLVTFVIAQAALLFFGIQEVMAEPAATQAAREISIGMGLAMLGAGIPTGLAAIGAGIAVGPVGAAALAVIAEKPEMFGRTLVYLGLAEGIAIYGLVATILILGRL